MKSRDYKIFRIGRYYHIFNRGNNKQKIFFDEQDYFQFLRRFKIVLGTIPPGNLRIQSLPPKLFTILSYCLMPNHFHMLIKQETIVGVDRLMLKLCTSYAIYFNKKYQRVGNVFQDTFKAKLVDDDEYARHLIAYIHHNPDNLDYPYSSHEEILGSRAENICDREYVLSWFGDSLAEYKKFVESYGENDKNIIDNLLFEE
jgi:putative transposase